ncbi:SAV_6107 family HEPN domain-containing protein [Tsukamurella sp. 8F]|uniref:SAV_6107 family HEPN domain-containing protein n=1 Tax=unclassified Tsukamurella TaxID=2633480 RepID=UPI0023B9AB27|nr:MULTISPECIES: SAV_6107 family HEPN domain-containing protein [unclassified Tsukamurella]MDF0532030.1 SAV_6107 family HEPN domain-containing protein [Tsukamurella sp. 8J]MDF0588435.1 SAV_6107 family HEPN domain-containing protein [Tsukamurella sp. 8F]
MTETTTPAMAGAVPQGAEAKAAVYTAHSRGDVLRGVRASRTGRARAASTRTGSLAMLDRADQFLSRAGGEAPTEDQFREIYLAALRGAAAVLAERETGVRRPSRNAWLRLAKAAPAYQEWASYFTAVSGVVAALETTSGRTVSHDEVATLHARVQTFLNAVEADLEAAA